MIMLFINSDYLNKKDAKVLKAQIEQQAKERRILEADYENRLKADLKAILVELQLEIEELKNEPHCCEHYVRGVNNSSNVIQQKINVLWKGEL